VDKVVARAPTEGVSLTAVEREMLSWSESDPDVRIDPSLPLRLASEISDEEYEKRIAGLLVGSFSTDMLANPEAEEQWRHASRVLEEGDDYISIMLDNAVGQRWRTWWQKLWRR
jgi:hypothetical protein